jgi:hypothetical protein
MNKIKIKKKSFRQSKILKNKYGTLEKMKTKDMITFLYLLSKIENNISIIEKN